MTRDQATNLRLQLNGSPSKNAKTVSIVSGKGGVGKSNIAINLAIELSHRHHRVLLVDLDVGMGNIDILLGQHAPKSIHDMLNEHLSIFDIIIKGPNDLAYVSGGTGFAEFFSMDQSKTDHFLSEFEKLKNMYDYIIFDIGAGVSSDSMFFILASEETFVVTTPEPTSITDAYAMVKKIIYHDRNIPVAIIMNRVRTKRQGKRVLDQLQTIIKKFLKIETKAIGILPDDPALPEAVSRQMPVILWKDKSPITRALKQLTENYVTNTYEMRNTHRTSFVQKLKSFLVER